LSSARPFLRGPLRDQAHRERVYRPLQFQKRRQHFIGAHDETLSVAMSVNDPDCSSCCLGNSSGDETDSTVITPNNAELFAALALRLIDFAASERTRLKCPFSHPKSLVASFVASPRLGQPTKSPSLAGHCGYAKHRSRSHDAVIRVYDDADNVIETHEHAGEFKEW
jgi:hypothetical protein